MDLHAQEVRIQDGRSGAADVRRFDGFRRNQLFLDELNHLFACLRGEATPLVTGRDGAQSLRIALAARQSIESRELVELA